jgi:hypothetical protein
MNLKMPEVRRAEDYKRGALARGERLKVKVDGIKAKQAQSTIENAHFPFNFQL